MRIISYLQRVYTDPNHERTPDESFYYRKIIGLLLESEPTDQELLGHAQRAFAEMLALFERSSDRWRSKNHPPAAMAALWVPSPQHPNPLYKGETGPVIVLTSCVKKSGYKTTSAAITIIESTSFDHPSSGNSAELCAISQVTTPNRPLWGARVATWGIPSKATKRQALPPCGWKISKENNGGHTTYTGCKYYLNKYKVWSVVRYEDRKVLEGDVKSYRFDREGNEQVPENGVLESASDASGVAGAPRGERKKRQESKTPIAVPANVYTLLPEEE